MARPINADVPAPSRRPRRRRSPFPAALKAIAGLFLLALVFLVAAILGGGSGGGENASDAPAPVVEAPETTEKESGQTASELGYPAFATANTTRVGGADPAATAAAVALAAYPAARPAQRPAAVTLVDAADWRGAIAAAALIAPPVGAPPLLSGAGGLPEASAEALASLDPRGSRETGGAQAFAIGRVEPPDDLTVSRVRAAGSAAAAAIAGLRERLSEAPPEQIVVAPSAAPAFAMPAAAWAARSGDPILFSGRDSLDKPTARALRANPGVPVYVLGPSSAISSDVVRQIDGIVRQVRRVSGEDPIANAIELARYDGGSFGWNVNDPGHGFVIARSEDPLDAAAAAPLSASGTWGPLLLTDSAATLPAALRGYLLDVKPGYTTNPTRAFYNHVWVIGDQEAIEVEQQAELDELAALTKIGGQR